MRSTFNEKKDERRAKVNVKTRKLIAKDKSNSHRGENTVRSIFCLKTKSKLRETEKKEDCFILDYVPNDSLHEISTSNDNENEVYIVAEKGQVACRDFPHSRHTCANFPFRKTNHESYCQMCYCFVCDKVAPCIMWSSGHCHATNNETWKWQRTLMKMRKHVQVMDRYLKVLDEVLTAWENQYPVPWETIQERNTRSNLG
ncbi:hypothetical protein DCAR_0313724 [Daucus carota subsp. sativus]|uniref:Uncharacterized protein n=1 Tax=Daucus carota subsp. sativus TaxID=79200 RepID=A0AAF0WTX8_DAUCS|nr:PREDICTED: uncharacterized protein LOC108212780 [Daucus carota subsp. sativus]WOG94428.1 hypothetical protein DCAR_0313724 [Daucus carota subsp. sativus]